MSPKSSINAKESNLSTVAQFVSGFMRVKETIRGSMLTSWMLKPKDTPKQTSRHSNILQICLQVSLKGLQCANVEVCTGHLLWFLIRAGL